MTLHIDLSADIETKLRRRAAASGKDMAAFVIEAVEEKLKAPECLSEMLAPIHAATRRSGMTEAQLHELIEETRDEVLAEKRPRPTA